MNARLKALVLAVVLLLGVGALSACGPTMESIPLPGTGVSGSTMKLSMQFADALNLADGAPVKVNGVDAGKVESISVKNFSADADLVVKTSAQLRQGLTAELRYTTPLGELYVDITNPSSGALLQDGAAVGLSSTTTAPTVEDALSEASLLINGGGLGSLQTIVSELNKALGGREGTWRDLLGRTNQFLKAANGTTKDIDAALHALSDVSETIHAREATIHRAFKEIAPAAKVLEQSTPDFTKLLQAVQSFAAQANSSLGQTRGVLISTLDEAEPVLATLAATRGKWAQSLQQLKILGNALDTVIPGDYLNVYLKLHLDGGLLTSPGGAGKGSSGSGSSGGGGGGLLGGLLGGNGGSGSSTPKPSSSPSPSSNPCLLGIVCL